MRNGGGETNEQSIRHVASGIAATGANIGVRVNHVDGAARNAAY